jgi:hypothetical protein
VRWDGSGLPRKYIARVVLSPQHKEILDNICARLGQSESETLRVAFLEYARSISLITEKVHGRRETFFPRSQKVPYKTDFPSADRD